MGDAAADLPFPRPLALVGVGEAVAADAEGFLAVLEGVGVRAGAGVDLPLP